MSRNICTVIFWGAIWGIAEATIGWLLHILHVHAVGVWMYPISLFCMLSAFRISGKVNSIAYVAVVAGLVKLVDLLIPTGAPAFHIINPALHIMLEGVGAAVFVKIISSHRLPIYGGYLVSLGCILAYGFAYRALQLGFSEFWIYNPGAKLFWTSERLMPWLGQQLIIAALLYCGYLVIQRMRSARWKPQVSSAASVIALIIALAVNIIA